MSDDDFIQRLISDASGLPELEPKPHLVWKGVRRRRARAVSGVALGCVALAGGVFAVVPGGLFDGGPAAQAPAASAPPSATATPWCFTEGECFSGTNGWTRELQVLVEPFVDRINAVGSLSSDFGVAVPIWEPPGITIYWHGALPAELEPIIAEAEVAGVHVTHVDIPYRVEELWTAMKALDSALAEAGIVVHASGITSTYSGIYLSGPRLSADATVQAQVTEIAQRMIGDIPISFVPDMGIGVSY